MKCMEKKNPSKRPLTKRTTPVQRNKETHGTLKYNNSK